MGKHSRSGEYEGDIQVQVHLDVQALGVNGSDSHTRNDTNDNTTIESNENQPIRKKPKIRNIKDVLAEQALSSAHHAAAVSAADDSSTGGTKHREKHIKSIRELVELLNTEHPELLYIGMLKSSYIYRDRDTHYVRPSM